MSTIVTAALLATTILVPVAEGKATRYNPGVMDKVVANRVRWKHIDLAKPHAGYIALNDEEHIGELAWIQWPDHRVTGPYLVADCGNRGTAEQRHRAGWAVDLSWELSVEFGVLDKPLPGVRVFIESLQHACCKDEREVTKHAHY